MENTATLIYKWPYERNKKDVPNGGGREGVEGLLSSKLIKFLCPVQVKNEGGEGQRNVTLKLVTLCFLEHLY